MGAARVPGARPRGGRPAAQRRRQRGRRRVAGRPRHSPGSPSTSPSQARAPRQPKLSKDAFRRQKAVIEDDLGRLGLRKGHLELALMNPTTSANFVELRRVTSELADVDQALAAAEEAWLLLEERAP